MQLCAIWWFVKMSAFGETSEDDPLGARAEDRRTWSSHSWEGSKPYLAFTFAPGNSLNSHMPSSAIAKQVRMRETRMSKARERRIMDRSENGIVMYIPSRLERPKQTLHYNLRSFDPATTGVSETLSQPRMQFQDGSKCGNHGRTSRQAAALK